MSHYQGLRQSIAELLLTIEAAGLEDLASPALRNLLQTREPTQSTVPAIDFVAAAGRLGVEVIRGRSRLQGDLASIALPDDEFLLVRRGEPLDTEARTQMMAQGHGVLPQREVEALSFPASGEIELEWTARLGDDEGVVTYTPKPSQGSVTHVVRQKDVRTLFSGMKPLLDTEKILAEAGITSQNKRLDGEMVRLDSPTEQGAIFVTADEAYPILLARVTERANQLGHVVLEKDEVQLMLEELGLDIQTTEIPPATAGRIFTQFGAIER